MLADKPQLLRSAPYFPVPDVERAVAHYERVLGFKREYAGPGFAIVSRDGLAVMLRAVPGEIVPNERQGGTWDVFFWVRDARGLHEEMMSRGAQVVYEPLVQEAYQMLEFAVRDGDGYVLGFGEQVAGAGH